MPDLNPRNTTIASKVSWTTPANTPHPGGGYHRDDIAILVAQSPQGQVGYYKGFYPNGTGGYSEYTFVVSLNNGSPMISGSELVAKPCPPLCGNDGGGIAPTEPIDVNKIPE